MVDCNQVSMILLIQDTFTCIISTVDLLRTWQTAHKTLYFCAVPLIPLLFISYSVPYNKDCQLGAIVFKHSGTIGRQTKLPSFSFRLAQPPPENFCNETEGLLEIISIFIIVNLADGFQKNID